MGSRIVGDKVQFKINTRIVDIRLFVPVEEKEIRLDRLLLEIVY